MNNAWSEMLIDLPVVWDLGLRITGVLGFAWMLHTLLVRCNPRWRVQLWRFTSLAIAAVLLAALMPRVSVSVGPVQDTFDQVVTYSAVKLAGARGTWDPEAVRRTSADDPWDAIIAMTTTGTVEQPGQPFSSWLAQQWRMILAVCWILGVCVLALRWLAAQIRIRRLLFTSVAAPKSCSRVLRRVADRFDLFGDFDLRVSNDTDVPFVARVSRPVIVLPEHMAESSFSQELPAIFAHELTHIKSHDLVWMGVSQWIAIPLWFHPLTWKMRTVHSMACEEVADAMAANNVGNVTSYSGTLARVALAAVAHPPAAAAISMARSPEIMSRLARLKQGLSNLPLARRSVVLAAVFGLMVLVPLASIKFAYAKPEAEADIYSEVEASNETVLNQTESQGGRVLNFPENRSIGTLYIALEKESEWWDRYSKGFDFRSDWDWKFFKQAQGSVAIPKGAKVKLILKATGAKDMSWVAKLKPDDLYELFIYPHPANAGAYRFGDAQMRHLKHLTGLTELTMRYIQVTSRGMRFIEPLQSLEKLDVYSPKLGNLGLKSIGKLASLEVLSMGEMKWNDKGLALLANLKLLEQIHLPFSDVPGPGFDAVVSLPKLKYISAGASFKDVHLEHLKKAKSLKALNLQQNVSITDAGLAHLVHLTELEYLDLWHTNITDAGIVHLKPLKSLKRLNIRVNRTPKGTAPRITATGMAVIAELKSLENLGLPNADMTGECLKHISGLHNLKRLWVGCSTKSQISDADLRHLTTLRNLENLNVGGMKITDEGLSHLAELTNLKSLNLPYVNSLTNDGIAKLKTLKQLRQLHLLSNKKSEVTISGLSQLNELSNLRKLECYGLKIVPGEDALDFSGLSQLENLTLGDMRDQDIATLANCKNLKSLGLGFDSALTDEGLAHLAGLRSMERLSVYGDGITDAGLVHFANMDQLNSLDIRGNLTDEGLPHIEKLKTLGRLTISSSQKLSTKAVSHLQASLPNVHSFNINQDRADSKATKASLEVGQNAPPFNIKSLDGKEMSLANHRGKVVLLYFWSTSCKPCIASIPKLKETAALNPL